MAAPKTIIDFIDLIAKSNILERRVLDGYIQKVGSEPEPPTKPKMLAQIMVRDGILTNLQAGLLLRGKWRNFIISGKYKLLERLGAGGMGSVYLCEHVLMRRRVALKVLPNEKVNDPVVLERFYREARAVAALDHRNIVRAHDIDHDGELHFLVLEYVDGSSLQHIVEKFGPLTVARAVNADPPDGRRLQHAHEAGLVHRDIKPRQPPADRLGLVKVLTSPAGFFDDDGETSPASTTFRTCWGRPTTWPRTVIDSSAVDIRRHLQFGRHVLLPADRPQPLPRRVGVAETGMAPDRGPRRSWNTAGRAEETGHVIETMTRTGRFQTPAIVRCIRPADEGGELHPTTRCRNSARRDGRLLDEPVARRTAAEQVGPGSDVPARSRASTG